MKFTFISSTRESDVMERLKELQLSKTISNVEITPFEAHGMDMDVCTISYEALEKQDFDGYVTLYAVREKEGIEELVETLKNVLVVEDVVNITTTPRGETQVLLNFFTSNGNELYINPQDNLDYLDLINFCVDKKYVGDDPLYLYVDSRVVEVETRKVFVIPSINEEDIQEITEKVDVLKAKGKFMIEITLSDQQFEVLDAYGCVAEPFARFYLISGTEAFNKDFFTQAFEQVRLTGDVPMIYMYNKWEIDDVNFAANFTYRYIQMINKRELVFAKSSIALSLSFDDAGVYFKCHNREFYDAMVSFDYSSISFSILYALSPINATLIRFELSKAGKWSFVFWNPTANAYFVVYEGEFEMPDLQSAEFSKALIKHFSGLCLSNEDPVTMEKLEEMSLEDLFYITVLPSKHPIKYTTLMRVMQTQPARDPVSRTLLTRDLVASSSCRLFGYENFGPLIGLLQGSFHGTKPKLESSHVFNVSDEAYYSSAELSEAIDEERAPVPLASHRVYKFQVVHDSEVRDAYYEELCSLVLPLSGKWSPANVTALLQKAIDLQIWNTEWSTTYLTSCNINGYQELQIPEYLKVCDTSIELSLTALELVTDEIA